MKYETPEVTALTPAVNAIQGLKTIHPGDSPQNKDVTAAYADWED
jgi:hypothetical protein